MMSPAKNIPISVYDIIFATAKAGDNGSNKFDIMNLYSNIMKAKEGSKHRIMKNAGFGYKYMKIVTGQQTQIVANVIGTL